MINKKLEKTEGLKMTVFAAIVITLTLATGILMVTDETPVAI